MEKTYLVIYWGNHTFAFHKEKKRIRLDVSRNLTKKHEASYFLDSIEQLKELFMDETCAIRFYISNRFAENDGDRFIELYNEKLKEVSK